MVGDTLLENFTTPPAITKIIIGGKVSANYFSYSGEMIGKTIGVDSDRL
jgi:hypothetical protein